MLSVRQGSERGHSKLNWLDSYHSFSFSEYHDPDHMGFSALRVINDDKIAPQGGFATHEHRNMEILSIVLSGSIAHKDSQGNEHILSEGEAQLMSAGSGIYHSEYNPSAQTPLHFLQIWIKPNALDTTPRYQQRKIPHKQGITEIATPDGKNQSLQILQNARILQLKLDTNQDIIFEPQIARSIYIHLIEGKLDIEGEKISASDAIAISDRQNVRLKNIGSEQAYALIFDLP